MKKATAFFKYLLLFFVFIAAGFAGLTIFYPVDSHYSELAKAPALPEDLDHYLQTSEAVLHPKPGTEKNILWAFPDHRKTPLSLVYLHGFSASRREISPVIETVAKTLNANVFFTRLTGHGLGGEGLAQAHGYQWVEDADEAFEIGKRLGDKVILLGYSTGAALTVHLARKEDSQLAGIVMMAPNFRPRNALSLISTGPLGIWITNIVTGGKYKWTPRNKEHAYYWTPEYPAPAIHELMELLKYINGIDAEGIKTPALFVYSPADHVISIPNALEKFRRWGSPLKRIVEFPAKSHVIAGDIVSPEGNEPLEKDILNFIRDLPSH